MKRVLRIQIAPEAAGAHTTVLALLDRLGLHVINRSIPTTIVTSVDGTDPRALEVFSALQASGVRHTTTEERSYSRAELRSALLLFASSPFTPGISSDSYNVKAEYDYSQACPVCGSGANQIGSLHMTPKPRLRASAMTTDREELLVSEPVAIALAKAGFGKCVRPAYSLSTGQPLEWWQIVGASVLPPMSPESMIIREGSCSRCLRNGVYLNPARFQIVYPEYALRDTHSRGALYSWETAGPAHPPRPARPFTFLTSAAYRAIEQLNLRGLHLEPVDVSH